MLVRRRLLRALLPVVVLSGALLLDAGFGCGSNMPERMPDAGRPDTGSTASASQATDGTPA